LVCTEPGRLDIDNLALFGVHGLLVDEVSLLKDVAEVGVLFFLFAVVWLPRTATDTLGKRLAADSKGFISFLSTV
jgi:hypothetical protein